MVFIMTQTFVQAQKVYTITVDATINPAIAGFMKRAIEKAGAEKASCLVIELNTPGGLLESTREITGDILNAEIPVLVYVSPSGAHAGSAGVFITLSAHIAAMAPGTNMGAAHPVSMQGAMDTTMNEKATNDAAAFIRTIAERRNRNVEWAEEAVRKSVSITATEALDKKVIDFIAVDLTALLDQADGKQVEVRSGEVTMLTKDKPREEIRMSTIEKFLSVISNPNIAYLLLMFGFYGIMFELYSPGSMIPGIIGVIGLVLGFYSLNTLPLNYSGLALILFGIILFVLEIKVTSYGMLTIGGIVSLLLGSAMLIPAEASFEIGGISRTVILSITLFTAAFFIFVIGMGIKAQTAKPVTGVESLIGQPGVALETLDPSGQVLVYGERWNAESLSGSIPAGEKIRVKGRDKFTLYVELITNT
jgi:membrane-bound serine protease (ClpP class)